MEDIIKIYLKEVGSKGVGCIDFAQDRDWWRDAVYFSVTKANSLVEIRIWLLPITSADSDCYYEDSSL